MMSVYREMKELLSHFAANRPQFPQSAEIRSQAPGESHKSRRTAPLRLRALCGLGFVPAKNKIK